MDRQKEADLSTPKDQERIDAFKALYASAAPPMAAINKLNQRTLARFLNGTKPPPPALLEELAGLCLDIALADRLRDAAAPATKGPADA